ncbi:MAG TPA: hypothetical protein VFA07_19630 [Chthonomonadaceae bacterium]|nr:hypothetical protein [Chthonomonadaceae bacterium]
MRFLRRRALSRFPYGACIAISTAMLLVSASGAGVGQFPQEWKDAQDRYERTPANDAITRLQSRIDRGEVTLPYDSRRGYLPGVLKLLHIPVSSQALVFSKTSFRRRLISPKTPRALYFNDTTYVGSEQQAGALEFVTLDPRLGAVFYILPQKQKAKPHFLRQTRDCLSCHLSGMTDHIPGLLVRSVYTDDEGYPLSDTPAYLTTDASPFGERWGGWYVTGTHGRQRHMGNSFAGMQGNKVILDTEAGANRTDLSRLVDTTPYLSRHSDIAALMVLEHQTHVQNLIVKAGYQTLFLPRQRFLTSGGVRQQVAAACEPLVKAFLFVNEAPLTDPVVGTSGFAAQFSACGPFDRHHRSLYQLDLQRRLLRYPCSFTIYSEAFDALPQPAQAYVYRRLWEVLSGKDHSKAFAHLSPADRNAVLEILIDTKPAFLRYRVGGSRR